MSTFLETNNKPEVPLLNVGYDFRIASSELREKLVTTKEDRKNIYAAIRKMDSTAGLMVLETCNRMEWIVSTQMPDWISEILKARMVKLLRNSGASPKIHIPQPHVYIGCDAILHVVRVVVGMESLAVGEAQIAGQFQSALQNAQREKTSNGIINRLGHVAGRAARNGYEYGFRSNIRKGIHGLITDYIRVYFQTDLERKKIMVAGMGKIGRKTADQIEETFNTRVIRLNRTLKPKHRGGWIELKELKRLTRTADALVVATGALEPVITEEDIDSRRKNRLLLMDVGIPRQVAESIQTLPFMDYRTIDHLCFVNSMEKKNENLYRLEEEIRKEIELFRKYCRSRDLTPLLSKIHWIRREFIQDKISGFFLTELSDFDDTRRKNVEKAMRSLVNEYSSNMFIAFHDAMESFWDNNDKDE